MAKLSLDSNKTISEVQANSPQNSLPGAISAASAPTQQPNIQDFISKLGADVPQSVTAPVLQKQSLVPEVKNVEKASLSDLIVNEAIRNNNSQPQATVPTPTPAPTPTPSPTPSAGQFSYVATAGKQLNPSLYGDKATMNLYNSYYKTITPQFDGQQSTSRTSPMTQSAFGATQDEHQNGSIDLGTPTGTNVLAVKDGGIVYKVNSYGGEMAIKYPDGTNQLMAHMSQILPLGTKVNAGDVIGKTGNVGFSTGPHLHIQILSPSGQSLTRQFLYKTGMIGDINNNNNLDINQLATLPITSTIGSIAVISEEANTDSSFNRMLDEMLANSNSMVSTTGLVANAPRTGLSLQDMYSSLSSAVKPISTALKYASPISPLPNFTPGQLQSTPSTPSFPSGQLQSTPSTPSFPPGQLQSTPSTPYFPPGQLQSTPSTPYFPPGQLQSIPKAPVSLPALTDYDRAVWDRPSSVQEQFSKPMAPQPTPSVIPPTQDKTILTALQNSVKNDVFPQYDSAREQERIRDILSQLDPNQYTQTDLSKNKDFDYEDKYIVSRYGPIAGQLSQSDLAQTRLAIKKEREDRERIQRQLADQLATQTANAGYFRQNSPLNQNPYLRGTQQAAAYDRQILLGQQQAMENIKNSLSNSEKAVSDEAQSTLAKIVVNPQTRQENFNKTVAEARLKQATVDSDISRQLTLLPIQQANELAYAQAKALLEEGLASNSPKGILGIIQMIQSISNDMRNRAAPSTEESYALYNARLNPDKVSEFDKEIISAYNARAQLESAQADKFNETIKPVMDKLLTKAQNIELSR